MRKRLTIGLVVIAALVVCCLAACEREDPFVAGDGEWYIAAFGSQRPSDKITLFDGKGDVHEDVLGGSQVVPVGSANDISSVVFEAGESGKVSDNDDGYQILYTTIDPLKDNFKLSAIFKVVKVDERTSSQAGFGICATDSAGLNLEGAASTSFRYYNSISCLAMSTPEELAAMRGVYGYVDSDVSNPEIMRRHNIIEPFDQAAPVTAGEEYRFELEKTDEGFTGRFGDEELSLADEGFIAVQNEGYACVGVFAARNITVEVRDMEFETSPAGSAEHVKTAKNVDKANPSYTEFSPVDERSIEEIIAASAMAADEGEIVCASFDGNPDGLGTSTYPLDLESAVSAAEAGQTILLKPGVYPLEEILTLDAAGTKDAPIEFMVAGDGTAVFTGGGIEVAGDWWHLRGIEVADAEGMGILISGSDNVIERCTTHDCGDTGLQITSDCEATEAELRESRDRWPARNLVINCDSFNNCDEPRQDADGFAAKLACGGGNVFYGCVAHHNVDDGWDLLSKTSYGPIGAVRIENCVSYNNGRTLQDELLGSYTSGEGNGFKLGGRDVPVDHLISNCVSTGNLGKGITSNGSPCCHIVHCTAYDNVENYWVTYTWSKSNLGVEDIISLPGPSTETDDDFEGTALVGDCLIATKFGSGPWGQEQPTPDYFQSLEVSDIARNPETGELSLNGAFEGARPVGAHF